MDIEGSVYATAELLSLRYPPVTGGVSSPPCSSGSLLLSSPWPLSSPSPPSSTSSSPSCSLTTINEGTLLSLSSSSSSTSSGSPSSSIPSATSPVPVLGSRAELGISRGATPTAVIFTTTSSAAAVLSSCSPPSPTSAALSLVDPVSSSPAIHALEVAHAPGKSILCVHEQASGDLIHFSSSCPTTTASNGQLNHVNGNGNEDGNRTSSSSSSSSNNNNSSSNGNGNSNSLLMESSIVNKDSFIVQNSLLNGSASATDTDGNLFPTLILTSSGVPVSQSFHHTGGSSNHHHHVIPMRLYASLTSASSIHPSTNDSPLSVTDNSINGSILTTAPGDIDIDTTNDVDNNDNATCILMTHHHQTSGSNGTDDDLHQLVTNSTGGGVVVGSLAGYATSNHSTNENNDLLRHHHQHHNHHQGSHSTMHQHLPTGTLGTTTILMNDCYDDGKGDDDDLTLTKLNSSSSMDDYGSTTISPHGKLKDILMNGHSHHHHHHSGSSTLLSSTSSHSTNVDNYLLHELVYSSSDNRVSLTAVGGGNDEGQQSVGHSSFVIPKEEDDQDDLEELKLHSVSAEEQSSFNETINSIYHQHQLATIYSSSSVISQTGSPPSIVASAPSSLSSSTITTSSGVIWSSAGQNSGSATGVIVGSECGVGTATLTLPQSIVHLGSDPHLVMLKDEDIAINDLDAIDDDDLLEAKEEKDDDDYLMGDYMDTEVDPEDREGTMKGELKCKFCGFVCCSKSSLGIHERRHTGERPFACKYCGRLFNSAQCCKHHERLHTGDKPFQCSYCGKKYAVSTRLKRHERVHTREEPYKCTECNKTFRWFDAFRDHRNTHTGVPLYLCSVCGKTFTSYLKFYYHERGHLMKKERDRDRLAKQRLLNGVGGGGGTGGCGSILGMKNSISAQFIPMSHTIDILKSLQRNSSASNISALALLASQNTPGNVVNNKGKKVGAAASIGGKGQSKKSTCSTGKANKKGSASTTVNISATNIAC